MSNDLVSKNTIKQEAEVKTEDDVNDVKPVYLKNLRKGLDPDAPSACIKLSRIPYGFFEKELLKYFQQFGTVIRVRVPRNKKTRLQLGEIVSVNVFEGVNDDLIERISKPYCHITSKLGMKTRLTGYLIMTIMYRFLMGNRTFSKCNKSLTDAAMMIECICQLLVMFTANFKGYAYVQFTDPTVAQIAAETMNGYLMFKKIILCQVLKNKEIPKCLTTEGVTVNRPIKGLTAKRNALAANKFKSKKKLKKIQERLVRHIQETNKKLADLGIDYSFNIPTANKASEDDKKNVKKISNENASVVVPTSSNVESSEGDDNKATNDVDQLPKAKKSKVSKSPKKIAKGVTKKQLKESGKRSNNWNIWIVSDDVSAVEHDEVTTLGTKVGLFTRQHLKQEAIKFKILNTNNALSISVNDPQYESLSEAGVTLLENR
uniref:RRM domain-containing protein n=1 Tax=Syphacia muris TaxID=451379 RepID=A0A0N5ADQ5_9BILA